MLIKIYLGLVLFTMAVFTLSSFAGWEFGSKKLNSSPPSSSSSSGRSGGGGFFFGGGGFGGGK